MLPPEVGHPRRCHRVAAICSTVVRVVTGVELSERGPLMFAPVWTGNFVPELATDRVECFLTCSYASMGKRDTSTVRAATTSLASSLNLGQRQRDPASFCSPPFKREKQSLQRSIAAATRHSPWPSRHVMAFSLQSVWSLPVHSAITRSRAR